jgi:hypothetical protein
MPLNSSSQLLQEFDVVCHTVILKLELDASCKAIRMNDKVYVMGCAEKGFDS